MVQMVEQTQGPELNPHGERERERERERESANVVFGEFGTWNEVSKAGRIVIRILLYVCTR
jgi:hypothetical protein